VGRCEDKTRYDGKGKQPMMKLGLVGAALVVSSFLAGPVMARDARTIHAATGAVCDPRDPGNPFSRKYDFMEWSAWRRRGGWDTRAEWTCQPIPAYYAHQSSS
jgi:hypothetical protein